MTKPKRILFVCMHDSPHARRWIENVVDRGWDLHVFPTRSYRALPTFRGVTVHRPFLRFTGKQFAGGLRTPFRRWLHELKHAEETAYPHLLPHAPLFALPIPYRLEAQLDRITARTGESDSRTSVLYGPWVLSRLIRKLQPDLIHSMEFQHCGYRVLKARELHGADFPPWLATNWGSDIYYYQHDPGHRAQIQRLLKNIDFYSCECERDIKLARELGMTAKTLPVMPNSGGFELPLKSSKQNFLPPSRRRLIMVKGYQHFAGRALLALAALERCADIVKNFDVAVFSASPEITRRAGELRRKTQIRSIVILPRLTHEQMLRMYSLARVYLGVSVSDGISTSALEAMAMGAFPIQTDTSCCAEWFQHGEGGYTVPVDDVERIADRVRSALSDDDLVDHAGIINRQVIRSRLDPQDVKRRVWEFYDEIFGS